MGVLHLHLTGGNHSPGPISKNSLQLPAGGLYINLITSGLGLSRDRLKRSSMRDSITSSSAFRIHSPTVPTGLPGPSRMPTKSRWRDGFASIALPSPPTWSSIARTSIVSKRPLRFLRRCAPAVLKLLTPNTTDGRFKTEPR